jgi:hypothetical protein
MHFVLPVLRTLVVLNIVPPKPENGEKMQGHPSIRCVCGEQCRWYPELLRRSLPFVPRLPLDTLDAWEGACMQEGCSLCNVVRTNRRWNGELLVSLP